MDTGLLRLEGIEMLFYYAVQTDGVDTEDKGVMSFEGVAERFPFFTKLVPDEEYVIFNEFKYVKFSVSRTTIVICTMTEMGKREGKDEKQM